MSALSRLHCCLLKYVREKAEIFSTGEAASECEIDPKTARSWLEAAQRHGLVSGLGKWRGWRSKMNHDR